MPKDSLKTLLNMFPHFFDKSEASNFFKSQSVTNNQFQEIYQSIRDVVDSLHLEKRCLIWKTQTEAYNYTINFVANYPNLKSVKCFKNDTLIYSEDYTYEDNISNFEYSYEGTTLNGTGDSEIIPADTFHIEIETYDEYQVMKGFPENDTMQNDMYDHDHSLDVFGLIHNVPRKEYILVDDIFLPATEPPYNNRESEDDYHYMNRMLNYLIKVHTLPLPVAEVWKLYGFEPQMENREKYLIKVFDENKHPFDEDTGLVGEWTPQPWEHQDKFCDKSSDYGEYFFVKSSTRIPVKNQNIIFKFIILDCFARKINTEYTVDIELNGTTLEEDYNINEDYICLSSLFDSENINTIIFTCKNTDGEIIDVEEVLFSVRGCNNADWYVTTNGNDSNTGKSENQAFATIQNAANHCFGHTDLIVLKTGTYTITSKINIPENCTIIGCGEVTIKNTNNNEFFNIPIGKNLILEDVTLKYSNETCEITHTSFANDNENRNITVIIDDGVGTT